MITLIIIIHRLHNPVRFLVIKFSLITVWLLYDNVFWRRQSKGYKSVSAQRNNNKALNDKNTVSSSVLILCNNLVEELHR